ncbi:MAG: hypothetical protein ACI4PE_03385 [Bacilli bacterium]
MKYKFENKIIEIPDEEIDRLVDTLEISMQEAIDTWLADNDYIKNEQEERLTKKAKENRITATIHEAKAEDKPRAKREVTRKENPTKERIIAAVAQMLTNLDGVEHLKITNIGKLIEFECDGNKYKLDLIQRRK